MVRINLLPAEILERRKYERFYPIVFIVGGVVLLVVLAVWAFLYFGAEQSDSELQALQSSASDLQSQADAYAIFEDQEKQLNARKDVAATTILGRIDQGKLAEEISVVLPEDVFLTSYVANQDTGLVLTGRAPHTGDTTVENSFKAVAATLVRLNSLDSINDVWLTIAEVSEYSQYQGDDEGGTADTVNFEATSKIVPPPSDTSTPSAPAQ